MAAPLQPSQSPLGYFTLSLQNRQISGAVSKTRYTSVERNHELRFMLVVMVHAHVSHFAVCTAKPAVLQATSLLANFSQPF